MVKKTKIVVIAEAAGGVDRYLKSLFKYIKESVRIVFICSEKYNISDYRKLVEEIYQINMKHDISAYYDVIAIKKIRDIIKKCRPDVIYSHSSKAGALARIADFGIKNKKIYNPHGWAFNMQTSKKWMYACIERVLALFTDKIVCISEAERNSALANNICGKNKLIVINNGIDLDEIGNSQIIDRKRLNIPVDAFVIGTTGRLTKQKSPDIFIKAAIRIKKNIPNAFFLMVGDGELRSKCERAIRKNGLEDSFVITGWQKNPYDYMKLFDVGLLLSRWEGFGLVIAEYMALGIPVVANEVDAIPYIIEDGVDGVLVKKDNYYDVTKKVIKIRRDDEFRKLLISNGKRSAREKYNIKRVAEDSIKLFES